MPGSDVSRDSSSYCSAPGEDFDEDAEGQEEEDHAPTFGSSTTYVPLHEESSP